MSKLFAIHLLALLLIGAAASAAELRGTVLNPDGTPAAGATVWAAAVFVRPALRQQTTTDDKGAFRLELQPLNDSYNWSIRARLGRMSGEANDAYGTVKFRPGQTPGEIVIHLVERGILQGRLLQAEDDRPVSGARLFVSTGEVLQTDDQGRFVLAGLPQGDHSLTPVAPGRARSYILFDTSLKPEAQLDIRLERGGKLVGRVVDEQDQPIPGAHVTMPSSGNTLTLNGRDELCGSEGKLVYDGLGFGRLHSVLDIRAPGYSGMQQELPMLREGDPPVEFTFRLKKLKPAQPVRIPNEPTARRELAGMVAAADQPVAGALVRWAAATDGVSGPEVRTDKQGRFRLADAPDQEGFVSVIADKLAPRFARVEEGQKEIAIALETGETARGIVRSRSGQPLGGVRVIPVLNPPDPTFSNPLRLLERETHTDAEGRFSLSCLPRWDVRFDFLREGFGEVPGEELALGGQPNEIHMTAGGTIRGIVLDPQGRPVRDSRIRVQVSRNLQPGETGGGFYAGYEWYGISFTSDDGTFVVSDMEAGKWRRVSAIARGYGQAIHDRVLSHPLDQLPPADQLTLRLAASHELVMRVVTQEQKPLEGARVTLIDEHPRLDERFNWGSDNRGGLRGWTDKSGWAKFSELVFGEATVLVECEGYERKRLGWRQQEEGFEVSLLPEAVVRGVIRRDGRARAACQVRLDSTSGDHSYMITGSNGTFAFKQLSAGDYVLQLVNEREQFLHDQHVTLKAGETRELILDVKDPEAGKPK